MDLVNQISSERKFLKKFVTFKFEYSEGPLGDVLTMSWGRTKSTSQGSPLKIRLGRPQDVRSGSPQDGQIGSSADVMATLEGDVLKTTWGPIFAGWDTKNMSIKVLQMYIMLNTSIYLFLS